MKVWNSTFWSECSGGQQKTSTREFWPERGVPSTYAWLYRKLYSAIFPYLTRAHYCICACQPALVLIIYLVYTMYLSRSSCGGILGAWMGGGGGGAGGDMPIEGALYKCFKPRCKKPNLPIIWHYKKNHIAMHANTNFLLFSCCLKAAFCVRSYFFQSNRVLVRIRWQLIKLQ